MFSINPQNKINQLAQILSSFSSSFLFPKVGLEWEFYLLKNGKKIAKENEILDQFILALHQKLSVQNISILEIEKEQGIGQIEVKTFPYLDILKLCADFLLIKKITNEVAVNFNLEADFSAQKFSDDCGSALQINLNILDKNGVNLFSKINSLESDLLLFSIAGIFDSLPNFMEVYCPEKKDFLRFDKNLNLELFKKGKFTAPVNISWGYNNRTAAIRVVGEEESKDGLQNLESVWTLKRVRGDTCGAVLYQTCHPELVAGSIRTLPNTKNNLKKPNGRRLEFRIPPANADIHAVLFYLLSSVKSGIEKKQLPIPALYGNAFDEKYQLKLFI